MPQEFESSEAYRSWNDEMIRRHRPDAYYENRIIRAFEGFRIRAILRILEGLPRRHAFLEVGCGYGFVLERIACARLFKRTYGVDLSHPSLIEASRKYGLSGNLAQADGCRLPFRTGIMDASAKGASDHGGLTVGILPDDNDAGTSDHIQIPILTGMGSARNVINVLSSSIVVACPGGAGTLSEIALALKHGKTVITLNFDTGGVLDDYRSAGRLQAAESPQGVVDRIRSLLDS